MREVVVPRYPLSEAQCWSRSIPTAPTGIGFIYFTRREGHKENQAPINAFICLWLGYEILWLIYKYPGWNWIFVNKKHLTNCEIIISGSKTNVLIVFFSFSLNLFFTARCKELARSEFKWSFISCWVCSVNMKYHLLGGKKVLISRKKIAVLFP